MPLTWNQCAIIIFILMLIGVVLALTLPVWLAPPLTFYTYIIYEMIALAWIPLLMLCLLLRPIGNKAGIILVSVIGVIVAVYMIVSLAHNLTFVSNRFSGTVQDCEQEFITTQTLLYSCTFTGFSETPYMLHFVGPATSSFVYRVD
jgi:hypothetical protein